MRQIDRPFLQELTATISSPALPQEQIKSSDSYDFVSLINIKILFRLPAKTVNFLLVILNVKLAAVTRSL